MAASIKFSSSAVSVRSSSARRVPVSSPRTPVFRNQSTSCNSWSELIAAAGDVDAPIAVPLVAAVVVTVAVTALVPAYLNRGQQAADKIFDSKQKAPLDKKKTTSGKTASGKTTKKR